MSFAFHPQLPIASNCRLGDLPRQAQFMLLTLRLAHELSVEDRNFQGFVYTLCGISRVERALDAVGEILHCLRRAPRGFVIESTATETLAEDERRLLALLGRHREPGLALAGGLVPRPIDVILISAVNRLADTLE